DAEARRAVPPTPVGAGRDGVELDDVADDVAPQAGAGGHADDVALALLNRLAREGAGAGGVDLFERDELVEVADVGEQAKAGVVAGVLEGDEPFGGGVELEAVRDVRPVGRAGEELADAGVERGVLDA